MQAPRSELQAPVGSLAHTVRMLFPLHCHRCQQREACCCSELRTWHGRRHGDGAGDDLDVARGCAHRLKEALEKLGGKGEVGEERVRVEEVEGCKRERVGRVSMLIRTLPGGAPVLGGSPEEAGGKGGAKIKVPGSSPSPPFLPLPPPLAPLPSLFLSALPSLITHIVGP